MTYETEEELNPVEQTDNDIDDTVDDVDNDVSQDDDTGSDADSENDDAQIDDVPSLKKDRTAQGRIRELANANREKENKIRELQEKNKILEQELSELNIDAPDISQYDDEDMYHIDKQLYLDDAKDALKIKRKIDVIEKQKEAVEQEIFNSITADFSAKIQQSPPEIKAIVAGRASLLMGRDFKIEKEIMESPFGVEVFAQVLKNVEKFNKLSDAQFLKEVGKIEAYYEGKGKQKPVIREYDVPRKINSSPSASKQESLPAWTSFQYGK